MQFKYDLASTALNSILTPIFLNILEGYFQGKGETMLPAAPSAWLTKGIFHELFSKYNISNLKKMRVPCSLHEISLSNTQTAKILCASTSCYMS